MKRRTDQRSNPTEFFPVEAIRDKRRNIYTGKDEYYIKWEGWAEKDNTWEPISNIVGCDEMIESFESTLKKNPV